MRYGRHGVNYSHYSSLLRATSVKKADTASMQKTYIFSLSLTIQSESPLRGSPRQRNGLVSGSMPEGYELSTQETLPLEVFSVIRLGTIDEHLLQNLVRCCVVFSWREFMVAVNDERS